LYSDTTLVVFTKPVRPLWLAGQPFKVHLACAATFRFRIVLMRVIEGLHRKAITITSLSTIKRQSICDDQRSARHNPLPFPREGRVAIAL
jgi:hypothetical protein